MCRFVSYDFKTFDKMFSRGCTVLKAYFSLSVHSHSFLSSVWSSSQDDPSGWIQTPRHRAERKVSGPETMVGRFLRVPVHCYANDWSLWVHLAGEAPTNQPLFKSLNVSVVSNTISTNLMQTNLPDETPASFVFIVAYQK